MAISRNVIVRVGADIKGLQKGMNDAKSTMSKFKGNSTDFTNAISSSMLGFKASIAAAAAAAVIGFAVMSKNAIKAAMDTVESENLFSVSMGRMADSARAWSEELQKTLGLNGYEVRKNVGLFYNMTTSMGLTEQKAYDVSTGITKLAYDMSSFFNVPYEDMFTKLQSGLSGEVEPLRRLGISVHEATVSQWAYKNGVAKTGATLTEQQKVLARYGAIMEQTKNAQGDLARTIKSPANQLRLLQTQLQLASVNFGKIFLPLLERVLPVLTSMATALANFTGQVAQFMNVLFNGAEVQQANADTATAAAKAQKSLGTALTATGKSAAKGVQGFDEVNQLQESMSGSANDAVDSLSALNEISKSESQAKPAQWMVDFSENLKKDLQPAAVESVRAINELNKAFSELFSGFDSKGTGNVISFVADLAKAQYVNGITQLALALNNVAQVIRILAGFKNSDMEQVGKGILTIADNAGRSGVAFVKAFTGVDLTNAYEEFKKKYVNTFTEIQYDPITGTVSRDIKEKWKTGIKELNLVWDILKDPKTGWPVKIAELSLVAITEIGKSAGGIIKKVASAIITPFKNAWDTLADEKTGLPAKITGIKDSIVKTIGIISTPIIDKWKDIKSGIKGVWTDLKLDAKTIFDGIGTAVKGSFNFIIGAINGLINTYNNMKLEIPSVKLPWGGTLGGGTIAFPKIPTLQPLALASGGITTGPTLAQIGERGREAVIPLENSGFVDSMSSAIGTAVLQAMQFGQGSGQRSTGGDVVIQIDSTKLARVLIPGLTKEQARIGNTAIIQGV